MKYCLDTVELKVKVTPRTPSVVGASETHVLMPILKDDQVSILLDSALEEGTVYTATLFFDSQYITSSNFSEYSACAHTHTHTDTHTHTHF